MVPRGNVPERDLRAGYEIWVSCDDCGDVVVGGEACVLVRLPADVTLAYPCTDCGRRSASPVPPDQLDRLLARGFRITAWRPPRELLEARAVAPPFTWDDLLDAHELLARTALIVPLLLS